MKVTDLREIDCPGHTAREVCENLSASGHKATRISSPVGMKEGILECRLVDGKWHYYVAAEWVQRPNADLGVIDFKIYAQPGEAK